MALRRRAGHRAGAPGERVLRPRGRVARPWVRLVGLAAGLATLFLIVALSGSLSADRVHDWVDDFGVVAPLVFVVVSASLTVALFPGPLLAAASGLLFGTALGFPISLLSAVLGGTVAFSIARWWGHDAVEQIAGPRLKRWQTGVGERGFVAVLYARILPGVPYNVVNYAAGLSRVRLLSFVAATTIGAAPRAFAYTALGGSFGNLWQPEAIVAIAILIGMAIGAGVYTLMQVRRARGDGGEEGSPSVASVRDARGAA